MSTPVVTFFNNKGGVGKTTLVYHLAWMLARLDVRVVALDLDPQANLTGAFLDEDQLDALWEGDRHTTVGSPGGTIASCLRPALRMGDLAQPRLLPVDAQLALLPGSPELATFEDQLGPQWNSSLSEREVYRPMRLLSGFWQVAQLAAVAADADVVLADVGPNLGAINRSALVASDYVVIPLGADLFSLQGLRNLGPTLTEWRAGWAKRVAGWGAPEFQLPSGAMRPLGYVVQQHLLRLGRPIKAYDRWLAKVPAVYRESVLGTSGDQVPSIETDPLCLAQLKHYRSLIPFAQESRKPIFELTAADGAIGAHQQSVQAAYGDFLRLASRLLAEIERAAGSDSTLPSVARFDGLATAL